MEKSTYPLSLTLLDEIFASCADKNRKVVNHKHSQSDVSGYNTYAWVSNVENIPNGYAFFSPEGTMIFNNTLSRKMIKDAVELQMEARGFTQSSSNPDMLINFSVLEKDTQLRTFVMTNGQDYLGIGPVSTTVRMVSVDFGTVLINFLDAESATQIWQGFASGALNEDDIKNMGAMKTKVGAIFEDFDFNQFSINAVQ
jgi:hypothetical protein